MAFFRPIFALIQVSLCHQSDVGSKFGLHAPDERTSLSRVKDLCFEMFFLKVLVFCWPYLQHDLCPDLSPKIYEAFGLFLPKCSTSYSQN